MCVSSGGALLSRLEFPFQTLNGVRLGTCMSNLTVITPPSDLAKPSKEQLALQTELQRLQSARKLDAEESDNQKQVLQAQLQSEVSHVMAAEHEKVRHVTPSPTSPCRPRSLTGFCNS